MKRFRTKSMFILALVLLIPLTLFARKERYDYAEGVSFIEANASPDVITSHVNDYIYQDEQINVDPEDGVVKVLRTDQKILLNDFVTTIIQCKNVKPRELRGPIRTMVRKEGGEADVLQDRTGGLFYLHVVCPRFQLPFVQACIAQLDETWVKEREDGSAELYYKAKYRNIRDVQNISQFYIGPEGAGRFFFDDLNNAMYYTDQPALAGPKGLQVWGLGQIDIPPNQVNMEVSIYEIDMNNDTILGLDWLQWKNGPGRLLWEFFYVSERDNYHESFTGTEDYDLNEHGRYSFAGLNAIAASQFLDFVHNKGYVRELVKTTVTSKSGDPSLIEAVDSVVHFQSTLTHKYDENPASTVIVKDGYKTRAIDAGGPNPCNPCDENDGVILNVVDPKTITRGRVLHYREGENKVGLRLLLTPYVALESMELDINFDVSAINGYAPNGNPILGTRHINNYVRLVDGQPLVIGGIDRDTDMRSKNGFPFLHKLPIIGWLFGNETNIKQKTQLVIVVKPKFILGAESVMEMPEEAKTIMAQATGEQKVEIPGVAFGFDQWLLDKKK